MAGGGGGVVVVGGCNPVTACPSCLSHNDVLTAGHANEWKEPSC